MIMFEYLLLGIVFISIIVFSETVLYVYRYFSEYCAKLGEIMALAYVYADRQADWDDFQQWFMLQQLMKLKSILIFNWWWNIQCRS